MGNLMGKEFVLGRVEGLEGSDYNTLTKLFLYRITKEPNRVIYAYKKGGNWVDVTWGEYGGIIKTAAMGFKALGIERGDRVAILSDISYEWYFLNMALICIGGITVGIYHTDAANQCEYILKHSDSKIIVCEDQEQVDKIFGVWEKLPLLEKMIVIKKFEQKGSPFCVTLEEFLELGRTAEKEQPDRFERELHEAKSDDVITLVYTSGTTGHPKGVMLTHANGLSVGHYIRTFREIDERDVSVDFSPMSHIIGQTVSQCARLYTNHKGVIGESYNDAMYNIWEHRPTVFWCTPRLFEKFYNNLLSKLDDASWFQRKCYSLGIKVGKKILGYEERGKAVPYLMRFANWVSRNIVFHNIREMLGGRVNRGYTGGAPIAQEIVEFFRIIGVPLYLAYGMTETSNVVTDSKMKVSRLGSSGKVLPGMEVRIADDGEILVRSPGNCKGYFKDAKATSDLFEGGWLHTGDVGVFDEDGFLFVTDRKKDIFITAGGKNVAPGNIENIMKTSKYISQCMVYGDGKKYLTALFTLDEEEVVKWARDNRIIFKDSKELTQLPETKSLIQKEIDAKNKELSSVETIKKFVILAEDFDQDKQEVTATQKVKRRNVTDKFKDQLEALYAEDK